MSNTQSLAAFPMQLQLSDPLSTLVVFPPGGDHAYPARCENHDTTTYIPATKIWCHSCPCRKDTYHKLLLGD